MVLKLKKYPHILKTCVSLNGRYGKRINFNCSKYLSGTVPLQNNHGFIRNKFDDLISWYDNFTGMDEVRVAQNRVLEDEDYFRKCQEERRQCLRELNEIRQELKELYNELETTNRGDERFVVLVTEEHKLLKAEKIALDKFLNAEKLEREAFGALSSSVKLSHEKERAQSERTKYWSIIGSVLGTIIGLFGSSINNHFKMNELKQLIKNSTNIQLMECINAYVERNEEVIERYKNALRVDEKGNVGAAKIEKILKSINGRLSEVEGSLKHFENISEKNMKIISGSGDNLMVTVPITTLEEKLRKEYSQTKFLIFTVAVLCIIMPVVTRYS